MTKIKVQAQHLQPGDVVGSGETVNRVWVNSVSQPSNKVTVALYKDVKGHNVYRSVLWGKYTQITVERKS